MPGAPTYCSSFATVSSRPKRTGLCAADLEIGELLPSRPEGARAEVAAALAKAVCVGLVTGDRARTAQRSFAGDWPDLVRVPVTEALVERAEALAWDHGLRGYDAVQLASAITWQEAIGTEILLATFDQQLWEAAPKAGLKAWPNTLPA